MLVLNTLGYFKDHTDKLCENIFYIFFLKFLILKSTKNVFIGYIHAHWFKEKVFYKNKIFTIRKMPYVLTLDSVEFTYKFGK